MLPIPSPSHPSTCVDAAAAAAAEPRSMQFRRRTPQRRQSHQSSRGGVQSFPCGQPLGTINIRSEGPRAKERTWCFVEVVVLAFAASCRDGNIVPLFLLPHGRSWMAVFSGVVHSLGPVESLTGWRFPSLSLSCTHPSLLLPLTHPFLVADQTPPHPTMFRRYR